MEHNLQIHYTMQIQFLSVCICFLVILIAADENDTLPYQSFCDPLLNNGECSDNIRCRCSTIVPTGERICTPEIICSSAMSCNASDKCNSIDSICVVDNRCSGQRLCYPISLTSPDICPPLATNDNINNEQ